MKRDRRGTSMDSIWKIFLFIVVIVVVVILGMIVIMAFILIAFCYVSESLCVSCLLFACKCL